MFRCDTPLILNRFISFQIFGHITRHTRHEIITERSPVGIGVHILCEGFDHLPLINAPGVESADDVRRRRGSAKSTAIIILDDLFKLGLWVVVDLIDVEGAFFGEGRRRGDKVDR